MQLNSIYFLIFFFVVAILYFTIPKQKRWLILLAANFYFYMSWSPKYIFFIALSILLNFYIGKEIVTDSPEKKRKFYLTTGISINLLALILFKYSGFILEQTNAVISLLNFSIILPHPNITPPIGISFYTLQITAYLLDTYNSANKNKVSVGKLALFAIFFPLQISGPIERSKKLLAQIENNVDFNYFDAREGLKRIAWGVFKKIVIANRLAVYVDQVFDHPNNFHGFPIILAVIFFSFQLYCDFSGYTDIVLGIARILGYRLSENFAHPYFTNSIQKFWNSWHISLSTWLRDYLFFPLRRNLLRQKKLPAWMVQIIPPLTTMLVSGLWHGANWTFILWGGLHGFYLVIENYLKPVADRLFEKNRSNTIGKLYSAFNAFLTYTLVCFGWVFFRANSVSDAFKLLGNTVNSGPTVFQATAGPWSLDGLLKPFIFDGGLNKENFLLSLFLIFFLLASEKLSDLFELNNKFNNFPMVLRWAFYVMGIFVIMLLSADSSTKNFIYFQF